MINQSLLDFIKGQLQKGVDKETISRELASGGWTPHDILEGFNAISQPFANQNQTPVQSSIPVSSFSSYNSNIADVSIKEKSNSGGKIFLIIFIVFLLAIGSLAYFFRNDLVNLPILKNIFPNNAVVISVVPTTPVASNTTQQNQPAQVDQTTNVAEKDCGTSYPDRIKDISYLKNNGGTSKIKDYDSDPALVCMGKALSNNCEKAKILVQSSAGTIHSEEIIGGDGKNCSLKMTLQDVKSVDVDEKPYENSYIQCAYPIEKIPDGCAMLPEKDECDYFKIKNSFAHKYINTIIGMPMSVMFPSSNPKENWLKCSGTMIDKITKILNTPQQNLPIATPTTNTKIPVTSNTHPQNLPPPSSVADKTLLTKTFKDATLGFEIKYPENFIYKTEEDKVNNVTSLTFVQNKVEHDIFFGIDVIKDERFINANSQQINQFLDFTINSVKNQKDGKYYDTKDFVFKFQNGGTLKGKQFESEIMLGKNQMKSKDIFFVNGKTFFHINYMSIPNKYDEGLVIFNSMMDSLLIKN